MNLKRLFIPFAVAAAISSCCNGTCAKDANGGDSTNVCCDSSKKDACGGCIKGEWNIVSANGVSAVDSISAFISFGDSCKVNGCSGVNNFFGSYEKKGESLAFSNLGQTKMMGPEAYMKVEDVITDAINKTASVKVCGDTAKVLNAEGKEVMVLVRKK